MLKTAKRLILLFAFATSFVMLGHGKDDDDKNYKYEDCKKPDGTNVGQCKAQAKGDCTTEVKCNY